MNGPREGVSKTLALQGVYTGDGQRSYLESTKFLHLLSAGILFGLRYSPFLQGSLDKSATG